MSSTKHYLFEHVLVLILGGGDLASGVAYRMRKAGFPVAITELARPTMVRTAISYGAAAIHRAVIVEGIPARQATLEQMPEILATGAIPVLIDPDGHAIYALKPTVLVDGRVAKVNLGVTISDAPLVVGLGPGFTAGIDCHAVVETNRGHRLGRVFWEGSAEPDTGVPGAVGGKESERVLRAPADGMVWQHKVPGQHVTAGMVVARVGEVPVTAPFDGVLRGLIDEEVIVTKGLKIGDIDPRSQQKNCFTISDKSLAVGGAVVEAVLSADPVRAAIRGTS